MGTSLDDRTGGRRRERGRRRKGFPGEGGEEA